MPERRSRLANLNFKLPIFHNKHTFSSGPESDESHLRSSHSGSLLAVNSIVDSSHGARLYNRPSSPAFSEQMSGQNHGQPQEVTYGDDLMPPVMPFAPNDPKPSSRRSSVLFPIDKDSKNRDSTLSLNYVPAKFTRLHAPGDYAHRRTKQGGGRDAFAAGAQRMGQMGTVDDDEGMVFQVTKDGLKPKHKRAGLRWNRFKWVLFGANIVLFCYGMATLISAILVWLNLFYQSDVIRVGNRTELIISTIAAAMLVFTSLLGFAGIFLNNRPFLAVFTFLLWVDLGLLVAPGYLTYKRRTFNLEGKINSQWSRTLGTQGRLRIQDALRCCGYFSPFVEATVSPLCYSRSNFPGCKSRYHHLERHILGIWYTVSFAIVPVHILIIVAGLLCSNHVTYRFGKGLTPWKYRLNLQSMAKIMDEFAGQIAALHGPDIANEAMENSSYNLVNSKDDSSFLSIPSRSASNANLSNLLSLPGSTRGISLYDPTNPRASHDLSRASVYGSATDLSQSQSGNGLSSIAAASGNGSKIEGYLHSDATRGSSSYGRQANDSVVSFERDDRRR
ncbi:uncharacterized protein L203_104648 [Cryptococcus depauperatus CBS 7841]|uniref:Uncharacterized protein n=1 Tax=Cryptococcus depauperatus CBS 7841 TaxID=1295531 RepID=A0A1E3ILP2_9TREE|nr:tetraspanin Tsp2 [Cryptococcus depauperatus CBS 7841]